MIKIFMIQFEEGNIENYQSMIAEYPSFQDFLESNANEIALPRHSKILERHIDEERKSMALSFRWRSRVLITFAQQIDLEVEASVKSIL